MAKSKKVITIIDDIEHTQCTKCFKFYPIDSYGIRSDRGYPYRQCTGCRSKKRIEWRENNGWRDHITQKNFRIKNRDRIREEKSEYMKKRYERDKDIIREKQKLYIASGRNKMLAKIRHRKGFDIGDDIIYTGVRHKIIAIVRGQGYRLRRYGNCAETLVPRRLLTPIKRKSI